MTGVSSYKLSDGRVVDVPYEGLNDFEKSFPDARKLIKTTNNNQSLIPHILPDGETKFNVSVFDIDSFYKKYPFAKTINPEDQSFVDAYITKKPKENKVKISHFIKPEDLNGSEEDVVEALSVKLAEIGVYIEDPTDFFGESVFLAKTKDRDFIESAGAGYVESQLIDSGIKKEFILDSDDFNAEETASAMNSYLEKIYDPNFIKEAEKRSGKIYDDYKQATDTPKLSVESFKESYREEQIESFKRASSSNIKIRVPELKIINSNPEKLKEYNKWKKGEVLGEISEENLNAFQEEYYKKQNNYKSTEFTSNLNQQTRDDIYALSSKEKRAFDYNVENINKSIDSFNNDTNIFLSKIEEYNNDKTKYSSKELLREQYILQKRQSNMIDLHIKLNKQADYLPNALRDFGANYNRLEQLATGFKGVGLGIASGTTQALTSLALGRFIDPLEEFVRYKRDISKESEQYQRDIEISDIKNLNDIGRWGAGAITQMIPSVSMAFTGSAALPLFFASGFGDKGLEMAVNEADAITRIADNKKILEQNKNLSLEQKLNIENQITQDNKIANLTDLQKISSQTLYGLAEVVFERLGTMRLLKNLTKSLKGLPAENWKQGAKIFAKETFKAAPIEGFTELATTLTQNTVDIHVLGEDKNYFEGGLETFAQGALMGMFFGGASGSRALNEAVLSEVSNKKDRKQINAAIDKIEKLTGKKFHNIDANTELDLKDPSIRKIVNELIGGIAQKKASILARIDSGALTLEQVKEIGEVNRKIRKLNKDFSESILDGKVSYGQLTEVKDYYRKKIEELIEQREALFGTSDQQLQNRKNKLKRRLEFESAEGYKTYRSVTLQALKYKHASEFASLDDKQLYHDNARDDLSKDPEFNKLSDQQKEKVIEQKARDNYIDEKIKEQILEGEKNTREYIEVAGYSDTIESDKSYDENEKDDLFKMYDDWADNNLDESKRDNLKKQFRKNINNGSVDGFTLPLPNNRAIIGTYIPNAIKNGRISGLSHELLHHDLTSKQDLTDKQQAEKGKKLLDYLKENQKEIYDKVFARVNSSYLKGQERIAKEEDLPDVFYYESFNALSDVLADQDGGKLDKGFLNFLKDWINDFTGKKSLVEGRDAYNFVVNFNKSAFFGGKTKRKPTLIPFRSSGEPEQEKAIKPDKAAAQKYSKSFKENVKRKFNNISEKEALPARDVWPSENNERKGKLALEIAELYEGTLVSGLRPGQFEILRKEGLVEQFKEDAKTNLSIHILNFNSDKNDNIHGWINSQVANKAQDAIKGLGIELETLPLGETEKQIPEQQSVTTTQERQEEEQALQKKTLDKSISISDKAVVIDKLKNIVNEVISDFNIGARDVQSTTKVSDFVAILKEKIQGKKPGTAFKLLRRAFKVGNSTINEYRENLIKNKKAILEGLTTSYLSRAFPPAIEKRIINEDGSTKFVRSEEWLKIPKKNIGKKPGYIDIRSTKEKGFEGDTTGKQAMRRVENISETISDEVFLAKYIVNNKVPQMPSEMLMQQLAGEIGLDIFQEEINKFDEFNEALNKAKGNDKLINEIKNSDKFKIISSFADNQAALANVLQQSTISNISMQLERGVTKYSSLQGLDDSQLEEAIRFTEDFITYKSSPEKQDSIDFENSIGDYLDEAAPYLFDYYRDVLVPIEELLNDTTQRNRVANAKEITARNIIDASLDELNKKRKQQGLAEIRIDKIPALGSSRKGDFKIKVGKIIKLIEYKSKYSDLMGSVTFVYNKDKGTFTMNMPKGKKAEITKKIIKEKNLTVKTREGKIKLKTTYSSLTSSQKKIFDEEMKKEYDEWKSNNTALVEKLEKLLSSKEIVGVNGLINKYEKALSDLKVDITKRRKNGSVIVNRDQRKKVQDNKNVPKTYTFERIEGLTMDDSISLYAEQNNDLMVISPQLYTFATSLDASNRTGVPQLQAEKGNKIFSPGMDGIFHIIGSANSITFRVSFQITKNDLQYIVIPKSKIANVEIIESLVNEKPSSQKAKNSLLPEDLDITFNNIIEQTKGVSAKKTFSDTIASLKGAGIGKYKFFVPPSADDFMGLMYAFMGKGKVGEDHKDFFEEALNGPYKRGIAALESSKQKIENDYNKLKKSYPEIAKKLGKKIPNSEFTYDQAIRVYLWKYNNEIFNSKLEEELGLTTSEINELFFTVAENRELQQYARGLGKLTGLSEGYIKPSRTWLLETIASDLNDISDKISRKKHLAEFIANKEAIFNKDNLNKIQATYGSKFRSALEDSLYAMTNGTSRNFGDNKIANQFADWLNGSVGAIMFFNARSAALQLISNVNYLNWSDNNVLQAATAFANQKQFWTDFTTIIMSDKLKQRRKGLSTDVQAAELANSVATSKSKYKSALRYLLRIGFTPTQAADAIAISFGGASFYRNRINSKIKEGKSKEVAEKEAWREFSDITDATQQSADAAMISQQQRNPLTRFVLAFQNTAMQYNRVMKKSFLDLINRRGNDKENISKIIYYGAIQNIIFNGVQQAMFAMIWGDDESDEKEKQRFFNLSNGMIDTILRGSGWKGAVVAALKNTIVRYQKEEAKGSFKADHLNTAITLLNVAPSIGSKFTKAYGAYKNNYYERDVIKEKGYSWDSPIWMVYGKIASAGFNIPADRVVSKVDNLVMASKSYTENWQKVALLSGWSAWSLGLKNKENEIIKAKGKEQRKRLGIEKAKITRAKTTAEKNKQREIEEKKEKQMLKNKTKNMSVLDASRFRKKYYKEKKINK